MEHKRIQKLLLSEYCDFSETVLVESPFAETTRDGRGVRQVALGLTPSRLVIAADVLKKNSYFKCPRNIDPCIESFELVSIYPLEFVTLSIFRRKRRRTLKARLIDGRAKYYELGGMDCRNIFWCLWCKHVRDLLLAKENSSSLSETTAASSSSTSTLYLLSSGVEFDRSDKMSNRTCRIWAHYGGGDYGQSQSVLWPRKDVYLGPSYDELNHGYYTPLPVRFAGASLEDLKSELKDFTPKHHPNCSGKTCSSWPCAKISKSRGKIRDTDQSGNLCHVLFTRQHRKTRKNLENHANYEDVRTNSLRRVTTSEILAKKNKFKEKQSQNGLVQKLSRFGFGINENCGSGLYLQPWNGDKDHYCRSKSSNDYHVDPRKLIDSGVKIWENSRKSREKLRHPRRYALSTASHFLRAFGPWPVESGERFSVQRKRASSAIEIRRQPIEGELRLPVSKRQLTASVSMNSLEPRKCGTSGLSTRGRVVIFWTPEYWYRPRAATTAYRELQKHLNLLRNFRNDKERICRRKFFGKNKHNAQGDWKQSTSVVNIEDKTILKRIFSTKDTFIKKKNKNIIRDDGTNELRQLLRMELRVTAWDLDSTTIAKQLTIIDRDLFLRIPCVEIQVLIYEKSSKNAPNIGAWIAFSHRISCLSASEILATKKLDMRTRLLSRFINVAEKCYNFGNFQSCKSILAGLQSPSIYRLKSTWSRLRSRHSTRYQTMERLCKIFRNIKSRDYKFAWKRFEKRPPILPYVDDLLEKILNDWENNNNDHHIIRKNRLCNSTIIRPRYYQDKNTMIDKKVKHRENDNKKNIQDIVEPRRSIGKIFSTAIMRIRHGKSHSFYQENKEDLILADREKIIARKVCQQWRKFVVNAKIRANIEMKIQGMDRKRRKVLDISDWLVECQRHCRGYSFPGHSLGWEFLLKARYREERENFFISLKLEPPCG